MTHYLAVDPGNTESAYALIDGDRRPTEIGKHPNYATRNWVELRAQDSASYVAIEMVASYGMAVGAEVFETCVWIGRFAQAIEASSGMGVELVYRRDVKLHHCHSAKAKDANIIQALIDRFAPNTPNKGKGTKADPGWFYGFRADIWQAYALAVYLADRIEGVVP